jgi:hypothetical protein
VDLYSAFWFAWNDEEEVRWLKYVLWKGVEEERVDAGPILAHFDSVPSSPMACFCSAGKNHKLYYRCEDRMHADRRTIDDVGSRKVKCRWKCGRPSFFAGELLQFKLIVSQQLERIV